MILQRPCELPARIMGGSEVIIMTYQKVTGPLMANSHPGSYCGQDAYSDMLIVEEQDERTFMHGNDAGQCGNNEGGVSNFGSRT